MASIMADHNVEGHFVVLLRLWTSDVWRTVWESLELEVESFERLGLPYNTSDRDLWELCQQREIGLLTANRNDEGPDSLEATIRTLNAPSSLPVLTIADPELVLRVGTMLNVWRFKWLCTKSGACTKRRDSAQKVCYYY